MGQQEAKKRRKKGEKKPREMIVLRPLLDYSKQEIQDYCDEQQIPYMIDESNADITMSHRNQIRHEIVMKLSDQELENRQ
jgi:tRNA(Ile)-lysidine synthase TilS/MesJ